VRKNITFQTLYSQEHLVGRGMGTHYAFRKLLTVIAGGKKAVLETCTMATLHPLRPVVKYWHKSITDIYVSCFISFTDWNIIGLKNDEFSLENCR
jgi:hypothetical protein